LVPLPESAPEAFIGEMSARLATIPE